jgi:hypothetical protein
MISSRRASINAAIVVWVVIVTMHEPLKYRRYSQKLLSNSCNNSSAFVLCHHADNSVSRSKVNAINHWVSRQVNRISTKYFDSVGKIFMRLFWPKEMLPSATDQQCLHGAMQAGRSSQAAL